MKIAFIVGSLEAGRDGVGDYVRSLAQECVRQGHSCALLAFNDRWLTDIEHSVETIEMAAGTSIEILRLSSWLSWRERTLLAEKFLSDFDPDWVSLHFVPYAFQVKGIVHDLPSHLLPLLTNRHVHVMFHELWIGAYTEAPLKQKLIGKVQKHCVLQLMRRIKPNMIRTSNDSYIFMLAQNGFRAELLPMFGSIPLAASIEKDWLYREFETAEIVLTKANRNQWWVFGFFGSLSSTWPAEPFFSQIHEAALRGNRHVVIAAAGRLGDEACWKRLAIEYSNRFRFLRLGELPTDKVSQYLHFIDFGIAPTPYGQIGKSSVVAAMNEHGLPVIVNRDDWHLRGQELAPPESNSLLYKLDSSLQDKLLSGLKKQQPELKLPHITNKFLESLRSGMA